MKKIFILMVLILVLLPNVYAGKPIRVYSDRDKGEVNYSVINPEHIKYITWDEDDKRIFISIGDTSGFTVSIKNEKEALKIIQDIMGSKAKEWINLEKY